MYLRLHGISCGIRFYNQNQERTRIARGIDRILDRQIPERTAINRAEQRSVIPHSA